MQNTLFGDLGCFILFTLASVVHQSQALLGNPAIPVLDSAAASTTFDYVIVGAGTAGMTLAVRLSEDANVRVAVLEAGVDSNSSSINQQLIQIPGADVIGCGSREPQYLNQQTDWHFVTQPQTGTSNRKLRYARGKMIGGSSARNFMIYQRASKASIDSWANLTGDQSWNFESRFGDYQKSVSFTPPKHDLRRESPAAQYDHAAYAQSNGPVQLSYPNTPQDFSKYMQLSLNEQGIKTISDFNVGNLMGVQYASTTIDPNGGHRSSSRAFFTAAQSRSNLVVYTSAIAKKIIFNNSTVPRATGVQFTDSSSQTSSITALFATEEVILSAGAFQSPQLLMVSGIGPRDQLTANKIPVLVENPNVGQGLQDQIFFGPAYPVVDSISTLTKLASKPLYTAAQLANFSANQLGPFTNPVADMIAFDRIDDSKLAQMGASVLSSYPSDWPHIEYMSSPGVVGDFSNLLAKNALAGTFTGKQYVTIMGALVAPRSRGTVKIASNDTTDLPLIDPGWLTDPVDQKVAIEIFKRTRAFFTAKAMQPILNGPEYLPGSSVITDSQILKWIRNNLMTTWHAACTCSMKTKESGGVLDSKFQVYGTQGLRVVDASSFPSLPPGHPQSTVYMIAERAADLIKQAYAY